MSTHHCFQGVAAEAQYEPAGTCSFIAGLETYKATPQDKAADLALRGKVLYLPDGFGLAKHNKKLADLYAERGYETTVVDYFEGDALPEIFMQYMPGTDIDTYDNFTAEEKRRIRAIDMPAWLSRHNPGHIASLVDRFFAEFCNTLVVDNHRLSAELHVVGHCFGGKHAFRLAKLDDDLIKTALVYHPAFLEPSDLHGLNKPTFVGVAETDVFTPDLTETLVGKLPRCGAMWKLVIYGGTKHGFASRVDAEDEVAVKMFEQAFDDGLQWMEMS